MTSRQSQLQEDAVFRLLRILESNPGVTQRELARRLDLSLGGLHYCLRALVAKGFVKLENFYKNPRKLGYIYVLTPAGLAHRVGLTERFLQRKLREYEALRSEIEALGVALRVGEGLAAEGLAAEGVATVGAAVEGVGSGVGGTGVGARVGVDVSVGIGTGIGK